MPDPKISWIAIDNAISTLEAKGWYIEYQESYKKKYEDSLGMIDSSIKELEFELLQINALYNTLDEISVMTTDPLTKKVAEIAKERYQTDKLIHARKIFELWTSQNETSHQTL